MKSCIFVLIFFLASVSMAQIRIACVGNSITQLSDYSGRLQNLLGSGYKTFNEGITGTTVVQTPAAAYVKSKAFPEVFGQQPDIITIKLGTNDANVANWTPYHAQFVHDYNALIDTFLTMRPKPQIWLVLCVPVFSNTYGINGETMKNVIIPAIQSIAAARNLPIIDCNTPMLNHPELFPDGVHPNSAGADSLAAIFYRTLKGKPFATLSDTLATVNYLTGQPRSAQTVTVSVINKIPNVAHLTGALTISKKSSWLAVTLNAARVDTQVITNTIDPSTIPALEGKYFDTVTVHAGNGLMNDLSYQVRVWVRQLATLTSVTLTPGDSGAIPSNVPFTFKATALDQYGVAMDPQPTIAWSATGGTVSSSGAFTPLNSASAGSVKASVQGSPAIADSVHFSIIACASGLHYDYYENSLVSTVNDIPTTTPTKSGSASIISAQPTTTTANNYTLRFSGYVFAPVSGTYTFSGSSDDGSVVIFDGQKLVDNDGVHSGQVAASAIPLGWGLHPILVPYFQQSGGVDLTVNWYGPGIVKSAIAPNLLFHASSPTSAIPVAKTISLLSMPRVAATRAGLEVHAGARECWEVALYTLDGTRIIRASGMGRSLIPFAKGFVEGRFLVVNARIGATQATERLMSPR